MKSIAPIRLGVLGPIILRQKPSYGGWTLGPPMIYGCLTQPFIPPTMRSYNPNKEYYGVYGWLTPNEANRVFCKDLDDYIKNNVIKISASNISEARENRRKFTTLSKKG